MGVILKKNYFFGIFKRILYMYFAIFFLLDNNILENLMPPAQYLP